MAKFDFEEALKADGVQDCPRMGGMEDSRFYYRFVGNGDVQLGIKEHFDRWANSVDFVFSVPKTEKAYGKMKARLEAAMKKVLYDKGFGNQTRI